MSLKVLSIPSSLSHIPNSRMPGCAIQKALEMGELDMDRWQSYRKLKAENDYMEDKESYMIAKGRREKEISKLIKKMPIRV